MIPQVYFGTILLEAHRWKDREHPLLDLPLWLPRIAEAGFDGLELWENHWHCAPPAVKERIVASPVPVRIFNSYLEPAAVSHGSADAKRLREATDALGGSLRAIKYNVAANPADPEIQIEHALRLAEFVPPNVRLLCECHPDTAWERPDVVSRIASQLPENRFGFMMHPFFAGDSDFADWPRLLGKRLEHLHIQMRAPEDFMRIVALPDNVPLVERRLRALAAAGFSGSLTLEFTSGVGAEREDTDAVWRSALADAALLRRILTNEFGDAPASPGSSRDAARTT